MNIQLDLKISVVPSKMKALSQCDIKLLLLKVILVSVTLKLSQGQRISNLNYKHLYRPPAYVPKASGAEG